MNFSPIKTSLTGVFLLLSCLYVTASRADDKKSKDSTKAKKETKYDRLFKDKKAETAKSKFITLHKIDGKLYFELPLKYLRKEMLLAGTVASVTDPTYITVGSKNFNPIDFYFELQDSSVVMKTPNSIVYNDGTAPEEMKAAFALNYQDPVINGFKIAAYSNDSSAVVFDVTSLLAKPNSQLQVLPTKMGHFTIKATPKADMSFIRSIKSFDTNLSIRNDFNYTVSASLLSFPISGDLPTTVGITYSVMLVPESKMRPRITDSRVGIASSVKVAFPSPIAKSKPVYLAHRWNLVPQNKKAYTQGRLSEPVKRIRFYLDDTFPEAWKAPIRQGVLRWNKAFEKIGFKNAIEVVDFPRKSADFDPDNLRYSCIRYIPNGAEAPVSDSRINPNTGEILNASMFIFSNVETLLHKWRFIETAAVDPSIRTNRLPADKFAEALSMAVTRETGFTLGLLKNPGASSTYATDSLRNARFTAVRGLAPSVMDDVHFNYVAQPSDKGVRLISNGLGVYDNFAIAWNYRYFDTDRVNDEAQQKELERFVDVQVCNPRCRYYRSNTLFWDPRVQSEALGNDAIKSGNYAIRNLQIIQKHLSQWIKNDEDSRIKEKLYLAVSQKHYALFKNVMSNVGGIYLNDMKLSTGVPRYQVVSKARQRASMLWCLHQATHFTQYANRTFERKGTMAVSYYDQLLEFIGYDLMGARTRVAVTSYLAPDSYTQKEYFDDLFNELFQSVIKQRAATQDERVLQRSFLTYLQATVSKSINGKAENSRSLTDQHQIASQLSLSGYGNPTASLAPNIDVAAVDHSELYFYNCLTRLKPMLERCLKAHLTTEARSHYEMLLFKVNKTLEVKK